MADDKKRTKEQLDADKALILDQLGVTGVVGWLKDTINQNKDYTPRGYGSAQGSRADIILDRKEPETTPVSSPRLYGDSRERILRNILDSSTEDTKESPTLAEAIKSVDPKPESVERKADPSPLKGSVSPRTKPSKLGLTGSVPPAATAPTGPTVATEPTLEDRVAQSFIRQSELKRTEPTTQLYSGEDARTRAEARLQRTEDLAAFGTVASLIGNSLTQLFAAQKGLKEGVDLSNIKTTTPDFKAFLDSAAARYKTALDREANKEGLSLQERDREQRRLDIAFADAINNETFSRAGDEFLLRQEQAAAAAAAAEKARQDQLRLGYAQIGATRDAARSKDQKETQKDLKSVIDQTSKELKTREEKALASRQVATIVNVMNDPDQSTKTKEALEKQLPSLIAKAGLDPLVVEAAREAVSDAYPGSFNFFGDKDNKAISTALSTLTEPSAREVQEIKNNLRSLQAAYGGAPLEPQRQPTSTNQLQLRARAEEWLKQNPNHPDAPALRNKLEGK
jgi:hypothetical protein